MMMRTPPIGVSKGLTVILVLPKSGGTDTGGNSEAAGWLLSKKGLSAKSPGEA